MSILLGYQFKNIIALFSVNYLFFTKSLLYAILKEENSNLIQAKIGGMSI